MIAKGNEQMTGISKTALIPPPSPPKRRTTRIRLRKSWTRLWWIAWDPDAALALTETVHYVRAFTSLGVIDKAYRRWVDKPNKKNDEIEIDVDEYEGMRIG